LFATLFALFSKRYDLIYSRNKFAVLLAFFFGKKTMFETYRRLGDESPKTMRWFAKRAKNDRFVGMVLHSNVSKESMLRAGFPAVKLLVLHNGVDSSDMLPILSKAAARQKLNLDLNAKYVVYTGNMQKNKCIESLVDIAAYLPETTFLLVGGKPEDIARLTAYCEAKNANNVMLVERLPINEVSPYLYAADALIIPPVSAPMEKFGRTVLPFKLFPYLAAGRPIVAPNLADMRELIQHGENGILVNPDDAKQNAEAIRALFFDEKMQEKLAANASETSRSLTWEARALKFKNWLLENYV
jgi:glycosyltransferase involved in cell wall biosynthesis